MLTSNLAVQILALVVLPGAVAGLAYAFHVKNETPWYWHVVIGIAASLAALVLAPAVGIEPRADDRLARVDEFRLIGLSAAAGFAGRALLVALARGVMNFVTKEEHERLHSEVERGYEANAQFAVGLSTLDIARQRVRAIESLGEDARAPQQREELRGYIRSDYKTAMEAFEKAHDKDPENVRFLYQFAWATANLGDYDKPDWYKRAVRLFDQVVDLDAQHDEAIYNRAATKNAYRQRIGDDNVYTESDVIEDLKRAVDLDPRWVLSIPNDPDLESVWRNPEIIRLIEKSGASTDENDNAKTKPGRRNPQAP